MGEAVFIFKCTEAEARKWDAHGKHTPAPVMIEGDIVEISFTPRLGGSFNELFIGYNTIVRLDSVAVAPSKDLEPIALLVPEVQGFLYGSLREPNESIIETKRLDSSGDYQLVLMKYRRDYGKQLASELFSFPLVKDGAGFHKEDGMTKGTPCDYPPTESQIAEVKAKVGWPKSGQ